MGAHHDDPEKHEQRCLPRRIPSAGHPGALNFDGFWLKDVVMVKTPHRSMVYRRAGPGSTSLGC